MIIAVPRERKDLEKRVAITPRGAAELSALGVSVLVETGAGEGSGFSDQDYRQSGAQIASNLHEVWSKADILLKVKEPAPEEIPLFRENLTVFCFLHLASLPELAQALLASRVTGIAYELVTSAEGRFLLLEPMSEVAGKLAVINGSNFLLSQNGGRGMLLGGASGTSAAEVVVIGAGYAGSASIELALEMGAAVTVLDKNPKKIDAFTNRRHPRLSAIMSDVENCAAAVKKADLLIGAALIPGAKPPLLVTEKMVQSMKKGSVIVDISIDQGGCIETVRPTTLSEPTYTMHGVIHYGVCNMPAQVPLTSTEALTNQTLPYVKILATEKDALKNSALRAAINTQDGQLRNSAVAQALALPYSPLD